MDTIKMEEIFINQCNKYKAQILAQIGGNGSLPHQIEDTDYMMIKGIDELLEYYFTYKLTISLYGWEVSEAMEEIGDFVADLFLLLKKVVNIVNMKKYAKYGQKWAK